MEYSLESILAGRPAIAFGAGEYFDRYCETAASLFDYFIDDRLAGKSRAGIPVHPVSMLREEKREVCVFIFQRSQAAAVLALHPLGFRWGVNLFDARWFGDIGSAFSDFVVLESPDEIRKSPEIAIYRARNSHLEVERVAIQKLPGGGVPEIHLGEECELSAKNLVLSSHTKICGARNAKILLGDNVSFSPETTVSCGRNSTMEIGKNVQFSPRTVLNAAGYTGLTIGEGSSFGFSLDIYAYAPVKIGKDCMFSSHVFAVSGAGHDLAINGKLRPAEEIRIGNHVWVGWGCRLLAGAGMGDGGMMAAGSIVNKAFGAAELAGGSPAKVLHQGISWERDFTAYKAAYYPKA